MSKRRHLAVERESAETYLLISLVSFGATVILVRLFLQLSRYPQLGSDTLHIAHLLWGGLLLFGAVLVVLIWDNPGALTLAAVQSGVGIGLFVDEVGKFITQSHDYFYPPAAPIIYGLFLLTVLLYLYVRRPDEHDPQRAMVHALEELQTAIYSELDERGARRLLANLSYARQSGDQEIARLATVLHDHVEQWQALCQDREPGFLRRTALTVESWGRRLGRDGHRNLILVGLVIIAGSALVTFATLAWVALSPAATTQGFLAGLVAEAEKTDAGSISGHYLRVILEAGVGLVALLAIFLILRGKERRGLLMALVAVILSLTALQLLTFYLDQFTAIIPALFQFVLLLLLLAYQQWYLPSAPAAVVGESNRPEGKSLHE